MTEGTRYCPHCGETYQEGQSFCGSCGRRVTGGGPPSQDGPQPPTRHTPQSQYQSRGPGMWSGVKIGVGMFIILPILLILGFLILIAIVSAL